MAQYRCPAHDIIFQTETDHTKPGTRAADAEGKETGASRHPRVNGVDGHVDCPLCKKAKPKSINDANAPSKAAVAV